MVAIDAVHFVDPEQEPVPAFLARPRRAAAVNPTRPSLWRELASWGAASVRAWLMPSVSAFAPWGVAPYPMDLTEVLVAQENQHQRPPTRADAIAQNVVKQFKVVAETVRKILGEPFFLDLLERLKADTERTILEQLKAAGMPATLAQISQPVIDLETAAELNFLREQLTRISKMQGEDAAAAPTIALQAIRAKRNDAGDFEIPGLGRVHMEPERATH